MGSVFVKVVVCFVNCSLSLATGKDFVLDLQCGKALMVECFSNMSSVEVEVSMTEVDKSDGCDKKKQPRVVTLSSGLERIVTDFVTVRQVVNVMLFLPGMTSAISREHMVMAKLQKTQQVLLSLLLACSIPKQTKPNLVVS